MKKKPNIKAPSILKKAETPGRDNLVDICGYAALAEKLEDKKL